MASASRAICCVQRPVSNGRRTSEATPARGSVAAPRTRLAKANVIRSELGSSRGQHCPPAKAIADAAPITTTKVTDCVYTREYKYAHVVGPRHTPPSTVPACFSFC
jgi:hypothetical protein